MPAEHAPKGGITIGGKKFRGGEFIPSEVLERASASDKAKLRGAQAAAGEGRPQKRDAPVNVTRRRSQFTVQHKEVFDNLVSQANARGMSLSDVAGQLGIGGPTPGPDLVNLATAVKLQGFGSLKEAFEGLGFDSVKSLMGAAKQGSERVPEMVRTAVQTGFVADKAEGE